MNITIGRPWAVCEKGGRQNNEDSVYPLPEAVSSGQKLFLVCDGVGGSEKGEVASSLACESFRTFFSAFSDGEPSKEFIDRAVKYTEACFDSYVDSHPEARGMATTLTMVFVGTSGVMLAHIGDSRIYQFRNGKIVYETKDHSLVNSLVELGKISREDALTHPQKNVITRAIQGTGNPTEADVTLLEDVKEGDCFFMCTDGVLERLKDEDLCDIFSTYRNPEGIKNAIMASCYGKTRDNFSFYVLPVQSVSKSAGIKQDVLAFFYSFGQMV